MPSAAAAATAPPHTGCPTLHLCPPALPWPHFRHIWGTHCCGPAGGTHCLAHMAVPGTAPGGGQPQDCWKRRGGERRPAPCLRQSNPECSQLPVVAAAASQCQLNLECSQMCTVAAAPVVAAASQCQSNLECSQPCAVAAAS
eukprot:496796-Pelagomonas_calceolata.AAC.13